MTLEIQMVAITPKKDLVDKARVLAALEAAMRDAVSEGHREVAEYPPQTLTKTGYVRTGTLKRSWSSDVKSGGGKLEGTVGSNANIAPYNVRVQGPFGEQVEMFHGAGWMSATELRDKMTRELSERLQDAIDKAAG